MQLWSQKHQKPCKPYSNLFNSTLSSGKTITYSNSHPVSSLSWTVHHGKHDLGVQHEQPSPFSSTIS